MIKRRALDAGLPPAICCHTFRATGITVYLENGGTLDSYFAVRTHSSKSRHEARQEAESLGAYFRRYPTDQAVPGKRSKTMNREIRD
jgi:hypothetical protein